jgi:hypothetical protein
MSASKAAHITVPPVGTAAAQISSTWRRTMRITEILGRPQLVTFSKDEYGREGFTHQAPDVAIGE